MGSQCILQRLPLTLISSWRQMGGLVAVVTVVAVEVAVVAVIVVVAVAVAIQGMLGSSDGEIIYVRQVGFVRSSYYQVRESGCRRRLPLLQR